MVKILAIESSCDETAAAVVEDRRHLLSNVVASQVKSHMRFGGVVPEIASRHHVEQINQVIELALEKADTTVEEVDAIAVTYGPGLVGPLLIGIQAAKSLAWAYNKPLIPVNHIAGHIYSGIFEKDLEYPLLALVASGGHTELVYMDGPNDFELVGETRDDAAGEAYDKVGRILGLPYPGGKAIDQLAQEGEDTYHFPRAMINENNYDFSFSGLKSAVINHSHNMRQRGEEMNPADLATSFQASVIEVLVTKTIRAAKEYPIKQILLAGGVAANSGLRAGLAKAVAEELDGIDLIIPDLSLCGDNAAMIGAAAFPLYEEETFAYLDLNARPGLDIEESFS